MGPGDREISELVAAAIEGDQSAWNSLVDRYLPLVQSVIGRYRLSDADGADVSQTVWLRLVQNLGTVRNPAALPGWIATTTRNECLRVVVGRKRLTTYDPQVGPPPGHVAEEVPEPGEDLERVERHEALLAAFADLPDRDRELLLLLISDPPIKYAEISERLGISIGSIGPTRGRVLERLRRSPALAALAPSSDSYAR